MTGLWILLVGNIALVVLNSLLHFRCKALLKEARRQNALNLELLAHVDEQTERIRDYNRALKQVHGS